MIGRILAVALVVSSCLTWACAGEGSLVTPSATSSTTGATVAGLDITGRVTERATSAGIPGASVTVQIGSLMGPSVVTDGAGFYSISGLKTGQVRVFVKAEHYIDRSDYLNFAANATRLDFQLMPAFEN
jgi:hypothetical protein